MTDDIVTRLRGAAAGFRIAAGTNDAFAFPTLHTEAADEIERLRGELNYWKALPYCPRCGCGDCQDNEQVLNNE